MPTNIQRKSLILNTGIYGSGNDHPSSSLKLSYELPLIERKERNLTADRVMLKITPIITTDSNSNGNNKFPSLIQDETTTTTLEIRSPEEPVRIERLKEAVLWNSQDFNPTANWSNRHSQGNPNAMYDERGWNRKALEYLDNSMTAQRYLNYDSFYCYYDYYGMDL
jgi:hypothetical protein